MRSELYETSVARFRTQGFDETTVREIVDAVGVSEPTFFNYFPTKTAVLDEYASHIVRRFEALLSECLHDHVPATETIDAFVELVVKTYGRDRRFMATVATRSRLYWGATGEIRDQELRLYELLVEVFRRGQEAGEVRTDLDPQRIAETFTGAYMLVVINWLVGWWGTRGDLADRLAEQLSLLSRGWSTA